jgi:serpin B
LLAAAAAVNALGLKLLQATSHEKLNVTLSPVSISAALALAAAGAKEQTATEMAHVLGVGGEVALPHLIQLLEQIPSTEGAAFAYANRAYLEQTLSILSNYLDFLSKTSTSPIENVDFKQNFKQVRSEINAFVEQQTGQRIKNLLGAGALDSETQLVLINAVVFDGAWQHVFKKSYTRPKPFYGVGGSTTVPMMYITESFKTAQLEAVDVVGLPYRDSSMVLWLLVPQDRDGISALVQSLDLTRLAAMLKATRQDRVHLALPKFKVETGSFSLKPALQQLGMKSAFRADARFDGISALALQKQLCIGEVMHSAMLEVDEEGTRAAAATAAKMIPSSEPPEIRADRPFVFVLRDELTGAILFLGRLDQPKS